MTTATLRPSFSVFFSVSLLRTVGLSTQPSPSLSSQAASTEAACWNWSEVVELAANTGTPNTVVYFGRLETLLFFRGQVTLVVGVVVDVVDPVDVTVVVEQLNWRSA